MRQEDVSLKRYFSAILSEQLDSSRFQRIKPARADYPLDELYAADGRDAGGVGVGLGGIFVYHQFSRRKPPRRSQKGDPDGDRGGGAGWGVVCDCEHDCDAGVLIFPPKIQTSYFYEPFPSGSSAFARREERTRSGWRLANRQDADHGGHQRRFSAENWDLLWAAAFD